MFEFNNWQLFCSKIRSASIEDLRRTQEKENILEDLKESKISCLRIKEQN